MQAPPVRCYQAVTHPAVGPAEGQVAGDVHKVRVSEVDSRLKVLWNRSVTWSSRRIYVESPPPSTGGFMQVSVFMRWVVKLGWASEGSHTSFRSAADSSGPERNPALSESSTCCPSVLCSRHAFHVAWRCAFGTYDRLHLCAHPEVRRSASRVLLCKE